MGDERDPELRKLLDRRPPPQSLAWVEREVGRRVVRVTPLTGGMTSGVHRLSLAGGGAVVLRRYVRTDVLDEEPEIVARELRALEVVAGTGVASPEVLAADVTAGETDVPALLMSVVPGRSDPAPSAVEQLAALLPQIHAAPVPADFPYRFWPYGSDESGPDWLRDRSLWSRSVEVMNQPWPSDEPVVFVHRDFHPGNVLWRRGRVSGVIDWQAACRGPMSVDAAWCASCIADDVGPDAAARFVAAWEAEAGTRLHPWAVVVLAVDVMAYLRDPRPAYVDDLERTVAAALAELG